MALSAGEKLGPYEILAPIGKGGMGEVYRAYDSRLNRNVAVKVSIEHFSGRFEREARAIAALNHPNICQIYDVGPNYLVMELIEGSALKGPLPVDQALKCAAQICAALEAAHEKGITHRDLKPSNILVTKAGVKLLDFGLAKVALGSAAADGSTITSPLSIQGEILGTASYMSPEQTQGQDVDARSDIFSFGAVLYEVVTGRRAFRGDSMASTLASILRDEPPAADIPTEIQNVISRCLRKRAADRFQTAAEVGAALEQAANGPSERVPSLAVLPFANLSADKDNEYFSDGLAEEILNALTQLPGLRVIARTSAFAFRGRENAIAEIGEKLQVSSVLHGSVRRAGNRIRIGAQLINVADESQLWSERYDREMRDVFDIQDEIAQAIVGQLKIKLGSKSGRPLVKRYTENLEAHSLYLKGRFHMFRLTNEELERGRGYMEQAVALEPGYAPALLMLAEYYFSGAHRGAASPLDLWPKARAGYSKALATDPELAEARAALSFLKAATEFQWEEALRGLDSVLQLSPGLARAYFWRGHILCSLGRTEEALAQAHRAAELDPLYALFPSYCAVYCLYMGQAERSLEHARHALDIDPNFPISLLVQGAAYSLLGQHEKAIHCIEKTRSSLPTGYFYVGFLAWAYVHSGRRADAERLRAELEEKRSGRYIPAGTLALIAVALGDTESAFRLVEESIHERDPNITLSIHSAYFQPLRSDPRYLDLIRRMKLPK
jgi:serine/threonine protein kinase/Flp pilus assembly protein TadD